MSTKADVVRTTDGLFQSRRLSPAPKDFMGAVNKLLIGSGVHEDVDTERAKIYAEALRKKVKVKMTRGQGGALVFDVQKMK